MKTQILKPTLKNIKKAAEVLRRGGVVIYPTETCYGMAANPFDEQAVKRIYKIKNRNIKKGLTVICSDLKQAERYCYLTEKEKILAKSKIPTTIIAEKKNLWPDFVNQDFAFRISSNKVAKKLAEEFGKPIIATSANISGFFPIYSSREAFDVFNGKVDLILDAKELAKNKPSRIIKNNKIIRN